MKQYLVFFLVEGEKFKLRNFRSRTSSLLWSAANSVGTALEVAAFGSGPDPKCSRASVFCFFFLSTTMVFAAVRTHFPRKNTRVLTLIELQSINNWVSIKISTNWPSGRALSSGDSGPGFDSQTGEKVWVIFCLCIFLLLQ